MTILFQVLQTLDELTQHRAAVHRLSQVISGQNITFERPEGGGHGVVSAAQTPAYFCPMVECKYHIARSGQVKHFANFKLLKQHYAKVHASRQHVCGTCGEGFGTPLFLARHACARIFVCGGGCGTAYKSLESLQTHCRRTGHPLPLRYTKVSAARSGIATLRILICFYSAILRCAYGFLRLCYSA